MEKTYTGRVLNSLRPLLNQDDKAAYCVFSYVDPMFAGVFWSVARHAKKLLQYVLDHDEGECTCKSKDQEDEEEIGCGDRCEWVEKNKRVFVAQGWKWDPRYVQPSCCCFASDWHINEQSLQTLVRCFRYKDLTKVPESCGPTLAKSYTGQIWTALEPYFYFDWTTTIMECIWQYVDPSYLDLQDMVWHFADKKTDELAEILPSCTCSTPTPGAKCISNPIFRQWFREWDLTPEDWSDCRSIIAGFRSQSTEQLAKTLSYPHGMDLDHVF